jgi:hypothetical protein
VAVEAFALGVFAGRWNDAHAARLARAVVPVAELALVTLLVVVVVAESVARRRRAEQIG